MRTVTLDVQSLDDGLAAFRGAWNGGQAEDGARISFASAELLWKVLTAKRWEILKAMTAQGPLSMREVARRVGRDVKAVHADIQALVAAGVVRRTEEGRIEFPFDAIHVDFMLRAA